MWYSFHKHLVHIHADIANYLKNKKMKKQPDFA